jgi:hypothetical protein
VIKLSDLQVAVGRKLRRAWSRRLRSIRFVPRLVRIRGFRGIDARRLARARRLKRRIGKDSWRFQCLHG